MLFSKALVVLSAVASATAYAVPAGTPDGTYVAFKLDGKDMYMPIADYDKKYPMAAEDNVTMISMVDAGTSPASSGSALMARQANRRLYCGCGYNMNPFDTDRAVDGLVDQYRRGFVLQPKMAIFTIHASVVAFTCSRTILKIAYAPESIGHGFALITKWCGLYIAGSKEDANSIYGPTIQGYMRYNGNGHDFCRESTNSGAQKC